VLFSKRLKNTIQSELKNIKKWEDGKKKAKKKGKRKTKETYVNFVNQG
jgi:hypothetical protein